MLILRRRWFNRIRNVLRYRNGPIPLKTDYTLSEIDLEKGRTKLDWFISIIDRDVRNKCIDRGFRRNLLSVRKDLTERREELFAPNVLMTVNGRDIIRPVPRTISPAESEFRKLRRYERRIKGNPTFTARYRERVTQCSSLKT